MVSEKARRTSGESSASTERESWAVWARCAVGKGMWRVLREEEESQREWVGGRSREGRAYKVQGKSSCFQSLGDDIVGGEV